MRGTKENENEAKNYVLVKDKTGRKRCSSRLGCRDRTGRLTSPLNLVCDVSGLCFCLLALNKKIMMMTLKMTTHFWRLG